MNTKIKGWNFNRSTGKLSADGSTSLDNLRAEKKRLETRLAQIPGLISKLSHGIKTLESDIIWLQSLNKRRQKNWEKENGKGVGQAIHDEQNKVIARKAEVSTLQNEQKRIPEQIKAVDRQIEALIQGESTGLSKGLNAATARQMGELELEKEQNQIEHEKQIKEIELEKAKEDNTTKKWTPLHWGLLIGAILLLSIGGFILYKRKQAAALKVIGNPVTPLP